MIIDRLLSRLEDGPRGAALTTGGAVALLAGQKALSLGLLKRGIGDLERAWRAREGFEGGLRQRAAVALEGYDRHHQDPRNQALHLICLPMSYSGAVGLIIWPKYTPPWIVSAAGFSLGLGLDGLGHALFERGAPATLDDPLSFVVAPAWAARNVKARLGRRFRRLRRSKD